MKPTILFDFDGTIADSRSIFIEIFNQLAEQNKYRKMSAETIEQLREMSIPQRCSFLQIPLYKVPFLAADFLNQYRHYTADIPLYEGISEMLQTLHDQGYQLAIISSNEEDIIRTFLARHQLNMIDEVYASRSLFGKHHVMKRFLKKHGLQPSEVLYVGDELRDVKACQEVGISMIWVDWGYDLASLVLPAAPAYTAHQPQDIYQIVTEQLPLKKG